MGITTKTYSRGNDDPGENQYETAKIEIKLNADDSICESKFNFWKFIKCVLKNLAWLIPLIAGSELFRQSLGEGSEVLVPKGLFPIIEILLIILFIILLVRCYKKSKECTGTIVPAFEYNAIFSTNDPQPIAIGPNFALRDKGTGGADAQLTHSANPPAGAEGDTLSASLALGAIPCNGGTLQGTIDVEFRPPGGAWSGSVQQTITYDITVVSCGKVTVNTFSAQQHTPAGRVRTPMIDITPSPGTPTPAPYPAHPGTPRTP